MAKKELIGLSASVYFDEDADLRFLKDKLITVIGYGNQGRAQALNLRDSGIKVIIGNIEDEYREKALEDGFEVYSISEASKKADIVMILLPDEIQAEIFNKDILSNLTEDKVIDFATGYNIAFKEITGINPPKFVDVIMIAPRMIGIGVRESYLSGEGFFSFVGVYQDHSGIAKQILLALAKAVGTTKKGAIETTFDQEAHLDLYTEQVFGPAFGNVLRNSIKVLLEAGYPPVAIFVEIYMSGEFSYTLKEMVEIGIVEQMDFHSPTSQYGSMTRGANFMDPQLAEIMKKGLNDIQSGKFAREWARVQKRKKDPLKILKETAKSMPFVLTEKKVREKLRIKPKPG
ncbi:MAG: ketol-acid reductoisomerase [Candidatus Helarchaeota archaeon]|nr:ketol-acid reductoisomerase [Candidatus Helarchaeota archaeon]